MLLAKIIDRHIYDFGKLILHLTGIALCYIANSTIDSNKSDYCFPDTLK